MTTPPNAPPPAGGYGGQPVGGSQSNTSTIMGVVGIVCWFCCAPAAIALGLIGESKAKQSGQSTTLPRIAWIGGIVAILINIVLFATGTFNFNTGT